MKRLSAALFLVIGLGCCGDTSPAGPKTVEFVLPQGVSSYHFGFRAHQSATGEISGYIVSRSAPDYPSPFVIEGRVTCLRVVGRRASIGGELQRYSQENMPDAARYRGWLLYVEDGRSDNRVSDRISKYIWVFDAPTSDCPDPGENSADYYRGDGDVVVSVNE
jgi:hypothetical protein